MLSFGMCLRSTALFGRRSHSRPSMPKACSAPCWLPIRKSVEPGIPTVMGNEALLTQCFSNLLSNGIKFAKPGSPAEIKVSGSRLEGWVRISFQDSGIGIPRELQTKIFGVFQRLSTDPEGTGIGLAIVRKAVERMSGRVSVESEAGQGSTFHLDLLPS